MDLYDIAVARKLSGGSGGGGGGSSDFSTAQVTVVESEIGFVSNPYTMSSIIEELGVIPIRVRAMDESQNFIVPLYKGMASFAASENVIVSGDATYDENYRLVHISGDCSIKGQLSY